MVREEGGKENRGLAAVFLRCSFLGCPPRPFWLDAWLFRFSALFLRRILPLAPFQSDLSSQLHTSLQWQDIVRDSWIPFTDPPHGH